MSDITRKLAIFSCLLFTGFCFWKAGAGLIGGADAEILPSAQAAVHPSFTRPQVVTTPIQEMRPGMRVVGRNPLRIQTESTIDPTPEGWRLVSVRMRKEDGTYFEAELLRPLSWIRQQRAQPGATILLNMPEMYVVGSAEVLSVSACPPIDPGDGPVVLSTFKNVATNVLHIYVEGEAEPIGVTAGHPIWSEDRQAFIHSDQLQPGERLRSAVGRTVRITSIEIRAGPEPVYNLEVAGEHVYSVTGSGLLVHNNTPCKSGSGQIAKTGDVDVNSPGIYGRPISGSLKEGTLFRSAQEYRREIGYASGSKSDYMINVAVVRYRTKSGKIKTRAFRSGTQLDDGSWTIAGGGGRNHSEQHLIRWLKQNRYNKDDVLSVFTERSPCTNTSTNCTAALREFGIPQSRVYYRLEHQSATTEALRNAYQGQ